MSTVQPSLLAPLPPIEIRTPRLSIVPFGEQHLTARYIAWLNDPEVVKYSNQRALHHTPESCGTYLADVKAAGHQLLAVECIGGDLGHIGNLTVKPEPDKPLAWLSILIGERRAWGHGYGTEAWSAVCSHLFQSGRISHVYAGTLVINSAMLAVMRRTGMREESRIENYTTVDGEPVDVTCAVLDCPADTPLATKERFE